MFNNYIVILLRNLKRNFTFSLINILGLTFGLAISILVVLYVTNDLSYDKYHKDSENIYRLFREIKITGYKLAGARVNAPLGPYLVENYPKVISQTRVSRKKELNFIIEKNEFKEKFIYADSSFFQIFSVDFIYGNPKIALSKPFSIVLTEKIARIFFGDKNPIGKNIFSTNNIPYEVTAVVKNIPENSHLKFDMLCSFSTQYKTGELKDENDEWVTGKPFDTYIKLEKGYLKEELCAEFPLIIKTFLNSNTEMEFTFSLQPLEDIYLYYGGGGSVSQVILFSIIGIFVLIIACINYINLNTANSVKRLKEIGVRVVIGAGRKQLIRQLLIESIIVSIISLILALIFAELLLPFFNNILSKNLDFQYIHNWPLTFCYIGIALLTGFISGLYPAYYLSGVKPVIALKGKFVFGSKHAVIRNILVVFQFAITIFLLCCTGIILMQLNHTNKSDLGFNKENIYCLELGRKENSSSSKVSSEKMYDVAMQIKNELLSIPEISKISLNSGLPFGNVMVGHYSFDGIEEPQVLVNYDVDENFMDLLEMKLVMGSSFTESNITNKNYVIVNETLTKKYGWDEPIGKTFRDEQENEYIVIGVVKDFHRESFQRKIGPTYLRYSDKLRTFWSIGFKINTQNKQDIIAKINTIREKYENDYYMSSTYLSHMIDEEYKEEIREGKMFINFAIVAIVIAAMGLYGLAIFISKQKIKEIGIRKVFGCSVSEIIILLSKNFTKLILIASLIGVPLAWYYMDKWLQSFIYQVENRWIVFVLAPLLAIVIAFVTIFYQSLKTANSNPVDCLRYE